MTARSVDPTSFRALMANWVTGVSLVTSQGADGPVGCTANALTSLSLDPPLLLVCFAHTARSLEAVRASRRFAVNVLSWDQRELSAKFASSGEQAEKFSGVVHRIEDGVPVIDGCVANLVCELDRELSVGDHAIAVGRPLSGSFDAEATPLGFFRSDYHRPHALPA
ncbi:MAG: flavin reductase family protein [Actinobacteria bacterium]|nr:flavin reductase family protein [Actinomycetota bacterium]